MKKLPTDMARVVVCTEKDIDEISSQINQELRVENKKLKRELNKLQKLHPKVRVDENNNEGAFSGGCGVCGGESEG